MADRSQYFRNRYLAKKATWTNGQWNRTPEQREVYNARMREYRKKNAFVIKVAKSLGIGMKEAREVIQREEE
jgi:ribosomal protein L7/L12